MSARDSERSIKNVLSLAQESAFPGYWVGWIPSYPRIFWVSGAPLLRALSLLAGIMHGEFLLPFLRFSSNTDLDSYLCNKKKLSKVQLSVIAAEERGSSPGLERRVRKAMEARGTGTGCASAFKL